MTARARWLLMATHVPASGRLGGIVRYTVELARALAERGDVELHLLTSASAAGPLGELVGGRVITAPAAADRVLPAWERWVLGRRLGALSAGGFDVVHGVKHLLPRGLPRGTRGVLAVHDMILADRPQDFPQPKRTLLQRPYAASIREADTLVCVSQATREALVRHHPQVAGRSPVVLSATSPALLGSAPAPVPALQGRRFGLVVGDTSPRKNLATAVTAWARMLAEHPEHGDAALALVGPPAWGEEAYGPDHARLVASGHLVQLTGIDDAALRWCYENTAVVLAPSLVEGYGLPAHEALDLGAPLVTSLDPALVEVSGDAALHVEARDVEGWARAVAGWLSPTAVRPAPTPRPRSWAQVAEETVRSVTGPSERP